MRGNAAAEKWSAASWGAALIALVLVLAACGNRPNSRSLMLASVPGGDASRGRQAILSYGCGSCHTIPGVPGADAAVGPPLSSFAYRHFIAGVLPNNADNLITWIRTPQAVVPGNAMPDMGVTATDARNIAAYLATLK